MEASVSAVISSTARDSEFAALHPTACGRRRRLFRHRHQRAMLAMAGYSVPNAATFGRESRADASIYALAAAGSLTYRRRAMPPNKGAAANRPWRSDFDALDFMILLLQML